TIHTTKCPLIRRTSRTRRNPQCQRPPEDDLCVTLNGIPIVRSFTQSLLSLLIQRIKQSVDFVVTFGTHLCRPEVCPHNSLLQEDPPAGVSGAPTDNNIMIWNAVIFGPRDTPFEDGTFKLTLEFTEEYPNKAPTVRFVSKMFHPNGK
ncbi:unnamed protein product, partial [Medioppia subpectinata]